ncbi:MAG: adenylyl-sulfate kinase [Actinobacteria bacterium]|nr:adenylyl-sulfate kinase [Actinomycetota bacterium]
MTQAPSPPQYCPPPDVLDDLELLRRGVYGPEATIQPGTAVSVHLPAPIAEQAQGAGAVEIVDPEGVPVARLAATGQPVHDGCLDLAATPEWLSNPSPRTFERYYTDPRPGDAPADQVAVIVDRTITTEDLLEIAANAGHRPLAFLVLAGPTLAAHSTGVTLIRSALSGAARIGRGDVVAIPLDRRATRAKRDQVLAAYSGGELLELSPRHTAEARHGLVLFFTGLSGSGKSTVARSVRDAIVEDGARSVTLLDGDLVRRHLSAGLGFSAADRETNIRRIGWVGAEISRHGGVAICSPIAPFASTRDAVRDMVTEAGGDFLLIHISTPLAECERRDRKGLYAKARRGEIPEFTGISSPYEDPTDADLAIDTTGISVEAAVEQVLDLLRSRGHLTSEEVLEWAI